MRQGGELTLNIGQREAELLRNEDEAHPADVGAQEAPLIAAGAQCLEQAFLLVEAESRHGDTRALRELPDGNERILRHATFRRFRLTSS